MQGYLTIRLASTFKSLIVLQIKGRDRMRHHMCPDEAFGMVFNLDNVIANTKTRQQAAWHRLAKLEGLPPPKPDRPLFDLRPERVITEASASPPPFPPPSLEGPFHYLMSLTSPCMTCESAISSKGGYLVYSTGHAFGTGIFAQYKYLLHSRMMRMWHSCHRWCPSS